MKWLLGVLLVLNLIVALFGLLKQKPDSDIHALEVNANQLKLLPPDWKPPQLQPASAPLAVAASAAVAQVPQIASVPAVATPPQEGKRDKPVDKAATAMADKARQDAPAPPADKLAASAATQCLRWEALDPQQLERVQGGLPGLQLASAPLASVSEQQRGSGKVWVFYPPLATRAETQTLVAELKGKGFDSYLVQTDGEYKGYLSLGLFGREAAAQALLTRLKAAGYDKGKLDVRGEQVKVTTLAFRSLSAAEAGRLQALQRRLYPGKPLRACS